MSGVSKLASRIFWFACALSLASSCAARRGMSTSFASNVSISDGAQEIATLSRGEYEVLDQATGQDATTSWFVLWFPVGGQRTAGELEEGAYYKATKTQLGCDGMLLPHPRTKRIVIPLLLVNVVVKRTTVTGRCVRIKSDAQMRGEVSEPEAGPRPVDKAVPTPAPEAVPVPTL